MTDRVPTFRRRILQTIAAGTGGAVGGCLGSLTGGDDGGGGTDDDLPPPSEVISFSGGDAADFHSALQDLEDTPGALLDIEPGTYRFDPRPAQRDSPWAHFELSGVEDARIDGNGARIEFRDLTAAMFQARWGGPLRIRNLTLDYETPPFAQGTITALNRREGALTLELESGYPRLDHPTFEAADTVWASVHTAEGDFLSGTRKRQRLWKTFETMEHLGGREWRLHLDGPTTAHGLEVGRRLAVLARANWHALRFLDLDSVTLQNVSIHAAIGMGTVIGNCGEATIRDVVMAPESGSGRLHSTNADGLHVYNCDSGPTIEGCRFERCQDDGIVVASEMATVSAVEGNRTVAVDAGHKVAVEPGNVLEPITTAGERGGRLPPVASIEPRWDGNTPERITFESAVDLTPGVHLASHDFACAGYRIRDNEVRNTMARNIRLAAPRGEVLDNVFDGSSNPSVLVRSYTGPVWNPQMWAEDLTIRDNEIHRAGLNSFANRRPVGVEIGHDSPAGVVNRGRPHRSITIEGTVVEGSAAEGMRLADVDGLQVRDCELSDLNRLSYDRFRDAAGYAFAFRNVDDVEVSGSVARGDSGRLSVFGWERLSGTINLDGNRLTIGGEGREPTLFQG